MDRTKHCDVHVRHLGARTEYSESKSSRHEAVLDKPVTCLWRCNLTALSHQHNLYFVAHGSDIFVHRPRYPSQTFPVTPELIIRTEPSSSGLTGHLSASLPHAINNIIVAVLGDTEVIGTVRDDGDCELYLVRHVAQALIYRARHGSPINEVRPIFRTNVGISAWGIAIHQAARMLAVSSNDHRVRIFKFGLVEDDKSQPDPHGRVPNATRSSDVTQHILNGHANIPCIAFCNTDEDPTGRWLLTTDIDGTCRVYDLETVPPARQHVQTFRFGMDEMIAGRRHPLFQARPGWLITYLDRRSFYEQPDLLSATGCVMDRLSRKDGKLIAWELTDSIDTLAECDSSGDEPDESDEPDERMRESYSAREDNGGGASSYDLRLDDLAALDDGADDISSIATDATDQDVEDNTHPINRSQHGPGYLDDFQTSDDGTIASDATSQSTEGRTSTHADDMRGIPQDTRDLLHWVRFDKTGSLCQGLSCPILYISAANLYLLQPPHDESVTDPFVPPLISLSEPLRADFDTTFGGLDPFDRMNMMASIPSLGVLVIASQIGRVLVLALNKVKRSAQIKSPATPQKEQSRPSWYYVMRVAGILPTPRQEKESLRPFAPLHGIATGPIQGTEDLPEHRKRWRLMMMYMDLTLLNYEISRSTNKWDGISIEHVIV